MNPFDFVNSILYDKTDLMVDETSEKFYSGFLTNRSLSYHKDTIFYSQEMNLYPHLDNKLQFQYLINTIKPIKRKRSKWAKKIESVDIEAIMKYYGYNYKKALSVVSLFTNDQLKIIRKKLEQGGVK